MHYAVVLELMFAALEMIDPATVSIINLCQKTTREIVRWDLCKIP